MIPKEALDEFKKLYKKTYGEDLSDDEVFRKANNLVNLFQAVYGSPSDQNEK